MTKTIDVCVSHPRKITPQTEAISELNEGFLEHVNNEDEECGDWLFPLGNSESKWWVNREWVKCSCNSHDSVSHVVQFLIELHKWCQLNELPLPDDCDPNKWEGIPVEQRTAIIEGLAAKNIVVVFDPWDL